MREKLKPARTNLKFLVTLGMVVFLLGTGFYVAQKIRKQVLEKGALKAGRAAFERGDWPTACRELGKYLSRKPFDSEVLKEYARAQLLVQPLEPENISQAIIAYRRLMNLRPEDDSVYKSLARLYQAETQREFSELAFIANKRLEMVPADLYARMWLAEALISQKKNDKSRPFLLAIIESLDKKPEKDDLYIRACSLLSHLALEERNKQSTFTEALKWLNRAVEYNPKSTEALVARAQFYREAIAESEEIHQRNLSLAKADIEKADTLRVADPRTRLMLSIEWMNHNDLKRAAAELDAVKKVDTKVLREYFVDPDDWTVARFISSGDLAIRMGNTKGGVTLADETLAWLRTRHQRMKALPSAVFLYSYGGKVSEARRCLDEYLDILKASSLNNEPIEPIAVLKALVAQGEGRPYRVIEYLEPITQVNTSNPMVFRLLAQAYSQTDQNRRSIRAMNQYLRVAPQDRQVMMLLVNEYLKEGNFSKALEVSRLTEKMDPSDLAVKLLRIEISTYEGTDKLSSAGRASLAAVSDELRDLRKRYPDKVGIRLLQAALAQAAGRTDEAESELKLAVKECREPLEAQLQLARLYFAHQRAKEAIDVLREAVKRHPQKLAPWELMARLQEANRKFTEARETLKTGIQSVVNPWDKVVLRNRLALLETLRGNRQAGIGMLEKLAEENPRDVRIRSLLLSLAEIRGNTEAAQKIVDQLREIQGQTGLLWRVEQASLWMESKEWQAKQPEITRHLQRCIDADPGWSAPVLLMGQLQEGLGYFGRAEGVYRKALADNPSAVDVADRLMSLLDRQKRYEEAMKVLAQVSASPKAVSNRRTYAAIQAGDLGQAVDELKLRIAGDPKDVNSRILLARIIYQQTRNPAAAFEYLDQAEKLASNTLTVKAARIAILTAEKRLDEARKILDAEIKTKNNFDAYLLRAGFLAGIGLADEAEKDYQHLAAMSGKEGYDLLGTFYVGRKKWNEAVSTWEKAVKIFPDDLAKKRNLMKALLLRNKPEDKKRAEELLGILAAKLPDDTDILLVRAHLLLKENNSGAKDKARELLEKVVQIDPTASEAYLNLIDLALRKRDLTSARELAIRGLGANPRNPRLLVVRAGIEREFNNPDLALELVRMALREEPENRATLLMFIEISLAARNSPAIDEAKSLVREALKKVPDDEQLQLANTMLLNELDQRDEAFSSLKAFSLTPAGKKSLAVNLAMTSLCRLRLDFVLAENYLRQAAGLAPDNPLVMQERVFLLGDQKKFDEIVKIISGYRSNKNKDNKVILVAASVLASARTPEFLRESKSLLEELTSVSPPIPMVKKNLAQIIFLLGEYDQAERLFREMLQVEPNDAQTMNDLAWLLADTRHRYQDALPLVEKALQIDPENFHFYDTRGVIYLNLPGRLTEARKDFEQCVRLAPPDGAEKVRALWQLGRVLAKLGNTVKSRELLETALQMDARLKVFGEAEKKEIAGILKTVPAGNKPQKKG